MNRTFWRIIWSVLSMACLSGAQSQRGVAVPPRPAAAADNGAYYALVVGINEYPHWPALRTAVNDARAIDSVLRERYGFQTTLLVDGAATRTSILNAFGEYRRRLRENDNLLIYYAGHGARDGGKAYWLPVDSDPDSTANWIIADDVTTGTRVIPARHILIISDSCYSGGMSRDVSANTTAAAHGKYLETMLSSKSRVLISSGRDEPVADSGSGGHSVFANAVLNGLRSTAEQTFTAFNLFSRYVQESVIGGSAQAPLYQMIQNSGHEYGDFVFVARSGAIGAASNKPNPPPEVHMPASPSKTGDGALPRRVSTTRLGADGRSAQTPADPSGALPLTDYRVALLEFRDFPQAMSEATVIDIAKWQIIGEQSNWKLLDAAIAGSPPPGIQLNPQRSQFVFEWQKYIDENAAFAGAALLPVFLRSDADWSFLKKEKGWDEQYDAYVYVFLFARDKIQGRQPEFAARELAPVLKKHLQMAVAHAPTKFYFDVPLHANYDVNLGVIRFQQSANQLADTVDLLTPTQQVTFAPGPVQNLAPPSDRDYHTILPPAARSTVNYNRPLAMQDTPVARPGVIVYGSDPLEVWRKGITGNTQDAKMLSLGAIAVDRQLKLKAIPLDAKRAEPLVQAIRYLHARIFISADRLDVFQISYERQLKPPQALMFAHVQGVDILGPKDEMIATIAATSLPAPSGR
jgi:hypothetical protein